MWSIRAFNMLNFGWKNQNHDGFVYLLATPFWASTHLSFAKRVPLSFTLNAPSSLALGWFVLKRRCRLKSSAGHILTPKESWIDSLGTRKDSLPGTDSYCYLARRVESYQTSLDMWLASHYLGVNPALLCGEIIVLASVNGVSAFQRLLLQSCPPHLPHSRLREEHCSSYRLQWQYS